VCVGGTGGFIQNRGGDKGSWVRAFRRREALTEVAVPNPKSPDKPRMMATGSEMLWENPMDLARGDGTAGLAVADDRVVVGITVTNNDRWQERKRLPHRLLVLGLADGKLQQELPLPAPPILGGLIAAGGRVYVTSADGTVTCFAAATSPTSVPGPAR
jgi:hypothetical protein